MEWPFECDGITVGLTNQRRPKVFLRATSHRLRHRFTAAHELGHVVISWHIESITCQASDESDTDYVGGLREREASSFGSHILIPDRFLAPYCSGDADMTALIEA